MKEELELLNKIYQDTYLASSSLGKALPLVESPALRKSIISQISEYDKIGSEAKREISNLGESAKKKVFKKIMSGVEEAVQLKMDSSPSRVSEFLINASDKRIVQISREMNKNKSVSPTAHNLARRLIRVEEESASNLRKFL
jgi:hypothetical protein